MYIIYTDGAYCWNTNTGGAAFIITKDNTEIFSYCKTYKRTTNNRMEILSAILAIEALKTPEDIKIVSDSMYLIGTMTKGYRRGENVDLWNRIEQAISFHKSVSFEWTRGHSDNMFNNKVDKLANKCSKIT